MAWHVHPSDGTKYVSQRVEGLVNRPETHGEQMQSETVNWMRVAPGSAGRGGCADESHAVLLTGMVHTTRVAFFLAIQAEDLAIVQSFVQSEAV